MDILCKRDFHLIAIETNTSHTLLYTPRHSNYRYYSPQVIDVQIKKMHDFFFHRSTEWKKCKRVFIQVIKKHWFWFTGMSNMNCVKPFECSHWIFILMVIPCPVDQSHLLRYYHMKSLALHRKTQIINASAFLSLSRSMSATLFSLLLDFRRVAWVIMVFNIHSVHAHCM